MFGWVRKVGLTGAPAVRRVKTYSAASGYVYQYFYMGHRPAAQGTEYVFAASSGREQDIPVSVLLRAAALDSWQREHGRDTSASERHAIAKIALFRAFDERSNPAEMRQQVDVGDAEVVSIAEWLGLD